MPTNGEMTWDDCDQIGCKHMGNVEDPRGFCGSEFVCQRETVCGIGHAPHDCDCDELNELAFEACGLCKDRHRAAEKPHRYFCNIGLDPLTCGLAEEA